jgi:hypothetical protein
VSALAFAATVICTLHEDVLEMHKSRWGWNYEKSTLQYIAQAPTILRETERLVGHRTTKVQYLYRQSWIIVQLVCFFKIIDHLLPQQQNRFA